MQKKRRLDESMGEEFIIIWKRIEKYHLGLHR